MEQLVPADEALRGLLTRLIADFGRAPSPQELADTVNLPLADIDASLNRLAANHSLLLHPGTTRPWVVHPFALAPGSCWVQTPRHGYWANCLYCAFGIAAALKCDASVTTRYGGECDTICYQISASAVSRPHDRFHFAVPPQRWWDNVIFSCSSFQPFRSDSEIDAWISRHDLPRGATIGIEALWDFARDWYGSYIDEPWRKRSAREVAAIFERHGLTGPFWAVN